MRLALLFVAFAVALGCSAAKPGAFPSRSELADIAERPVLPNLFPKADVAGEAWTLAGPLPEAIETRAYAGSEAVDAALRAIADRRPGLVFASTAMHCAAQETGRYIAERGARPPVDVERFIAARCGATRTDYTYGWLSLPVGVGDEAASMQRLLAEAPKTIGGVTSTGSVTAGAALVRGSKQIVLLAASQARDAVVEPVPFVPQGGRVVLRGEVLQPTAFVRAVVNRGAFGYAVCDTKKDVRLPAFEITCEVAPEDDFTWIEAVAVPPGRILGHAFVDALVFPKGAPTPTFTPSRRDDANVAPTAHAIIDALNARRAEASLPPVVLDLPESAVVTKVAPHYFEAATGRVEEIIADKVVLGVKAGWDVDGLVRVGDSASIIAQGATGPTSIVDLVLESPSRREALFNPEVRRVAVGLVLDPGSRSVGALFGAYALIDPARHGQEAADFVALLTRLRAARGLPPPVVEPGAAPLAAKAAREFERGGTADDALKELMASAVAALHVGVRGVCLQGGSIATISVPEELVAAPDLHIGLAVGHHKEEDQPHATLAVFVVMAVAGRPLNSAHAEQGRPAL